MRHHNDFFRFLSDMRNFKLVKNPHEHFATFWKQQQEGPRGLADLQADLMRAAQHVSERHSVSHFATIEVVSPLFPTSEAGEGNQSFVPPQAPTPSADSPQIYWLVSGDVVEVALIACQIVEHQKELDRLAQQQERDHFAQLYADQDN